MARSNRVGVTFRTGGTSLSGQTVGPGIICELRTEWNRSEVIDNGRKIWFEPGLTANQINHILYPHHTHIGPDPASSQAAMMGGILSNNSSGMQAGVAHNSFPDAADCRMDRRSGKSRLPIFPVVRYEDIRFVEFRQGGYKLIDITQWLANEIMPRLKVTSPKGRIVLHPTCASRILGVDSLLEKVARMCAGEVVVPPNTYCCGAAGDRGFIFPEVAKGATLDERRDIGDEKFDGYYSLARTCEMSMMDTMSLPYESILYLVEETTR